eukprot:scaffold11032_cov122-Cylindrotheca_fusiformis.AAC.10
MEIDHGHIRPGKEKASVGRITKMRGLFVLLLLFAFQAEAEIVPLDLILDATPEEVHYIEGWLRAPAVINFTNVQFKTTRSLDFLFDDDDGLIDDLIDAPTPTPSAGGDPSLAPTGLNSDPGDALSGQPSTVTPSGDGGSDGPSTNPVDGPVSPPGDTGSGGGDGSPVPSSAPTDLNSDPGDGLSGQPSTVTPSGPSTDAGSVGGTISTVPSPAPSPAPSPDFDRRALDNGQEVNQIVHFVLFLIPNDCKKDFYGVCDWTALGVGALDNFVEGGISYCCSEDTAGRGLCNSNDIGRLILDSVLFSGQQKTVDVPAEEETDFNFPDEDRAFNVDTSGDYVLLMANCYGQGIDVLEVGSMEWKSEDRGLLPAHLYGLMLFYSAITAIYFVLIVFYYCGMRMFQDSAIPIQRYIFATMILGFFELLARASDLGFWNLNGTRSLGIVYISIALGCLKRGIANSLGVMVAKGWGIVRESLGITLAKIVFLGLVYTGITGFLQKLLGGILRTDQQWFFEGVMQLNYLLILVGVAILWRPNPNAKDYAMQMQIPTMGEDDENDLELSCVVPSAGDMGYGNDPDHPNGIRADEGQFS